MHQHRLHDHHGGQSGGSRNECECGRVQQRRSDQSLRATGRNTHSRRHLGSTRWRSARRQLPARHRCAWHLHLHGRRRWCMRRSAEQHGERDGVPTADCGHAIEPRRVQHRCAAIPLRALGWKRASRWRLERTIASRWWQLQSCDDESGRVHLHGDRHRALPERNGHCYSERECTTQRGQRCEHHLVQHQRAGGAGDAARRITGWHRLVDGTRRRRIERRPRPGSGSTRRVHLHSNRHSALPE